VIVEGLQRVRPGASVKVLSPGAEPTGQPEADETSQPPAKAN